MFPCSQTIERRLDELEKRLPPLSAASLRIQRLIMSRIAETAIDVADAWQESARSAFGRTSTAAKTVAGTARRAGEDTASVASTAAKTVIGQTEAQGRMTAETVSSELGEMVDAGRDAVADAHDMAVEVLDALEPVVDPAVTATGDTYESMTKAELYRRATDEDIEGRSKMSKSELIEALSDV